MTCGCLKVVSEKYYSCWHHYQSKVSVFAQMGETILLLDNTFYLLSFWQGMRIIIDLLVENLPSWFMLLGCSTIFCYFLMTCNI
jgi:hypothetical protein